MFIIKLNIILRKSCGKQFMHGYKLYIVNCMQENVECDKTKRKKDEMFKIHKRSRINNEYMTR